MATDSIIAVPKADENAPSGTTIAELVYQRVEQIMADSDISRLQAFKTVAEETGRPHGTISTHYYRHARANGLARSRVAVRSRAAESGDVLAAAKVALGRVTQLADDVSALQASLELLAENAEAQQAEFAVFEKVRRALSSD